MQLANMSLHLLQKNVSYVLCYADKSDMGHTVWSKIEIDIFTLYSMACIIKMQHANMGPASFAKNVLYVLCYADESDMGHTV